VCCTLLHLCTLNRKGLRNARNSLFRLSMFWKSWRSKFEKKNSSVQVNRCVDHTAVAEKFAVHFTKAYSCNNANCADQLDKEYVETRAAYSVFR